MHAESPDESWARVTELLESGRGLDVTLRRHASDELDAREYHRRSVTGVRAVVHGHVAVSEPEWSGSRLKIHTGAGTSYLDQPNLARIDVESLETMTYDVVNW